MAKKTSQSKKNKLYPKEKAFADKYIETGNGTQSALEVYDTDDYHTAGGIASENLKKPKIIDYIESKLSDEMLAEKHLSLINANTLEKLHFDEHEEDNVIEEMVSKMEGYELLKIVERKDKSGEVISKFAYVKSPDLNTQDKALDKAYKIKGKYKTEEKPPETKNTYNFILTPEFQGRIKPLEEELKKQFRNAKPNKEVLQDAEIVQEE